MAHKQIFISHAQEDKRIANNVRAGLENAGITCWIAPRDIPPGTSWAKAIVRGIKESDGFLLILTHHSNESDHVSQEVRLAFDEDMPIFGIRLEDIKVSEEIQYFVGGQQYIEAVGMPMEEYMRKLVTGLKSRLASEDSVPPRQPVTPVDIKIRPPKPPPRRSFKPLLIGLGVVVALMAVLWMVNKNARNLPPDAEATEREVIPQGEEPNNGGGTRPSLDIAANPNLRDRISRGTINQQELNPGIITAARVRKVEDNTLNMTFVYIPHGTFTMGSKTGADNESPPHEVTISKGFYMSEHEVTQEQWYNIVRSNPSQQRGADHPVENVSLSDVMKFIAVLNEKSQHTYRLPTEAEWERAARAGTNTMYSFGDDADLMKAYGIIGKNPHQPVKQLRFNPYQLYDMHGNVAEWTSDRRRNYSNSKETDPTGPTRGNAGFVVRGGGWASSPKEATSSARMVVDPRMQSPQIGFRLVRELD